MLANSLINTYYGPIGSLKWEQNLTKRSASVERMKDGAKEEQKKCLVLIQMDSLTSLMGFPYSGIQFSQCDWLGLDHME